MTTLIFIENVLGSGQMVKLTEDFGDYSVSRDLRPGETPAWWLASSRASSVEEVADQRHRGGRRQRDRPHHHLPAPRTLERRCG